MGMKSVHLTLASAPALVLFRGSPEDSARHGTILFYHGFGASTALLSQIAGLDANQPPAAVRTFHEHLASYYVSAPERLHAIEYPNSPYELTQQDAEQAWNAVVNWFALFLASR